MLVIKKCEECNKDFESEMWRNQAFCSKSCSISSRYPDDVGLFDRRDIDEFIKYYIMGLILSDGCISKSSNKSKVVRISSKDWYLIDMVNEIVSPTKKIHYDGNNKQVRWKSDFDIKVLESFGIMERKSLNVKFPKIPDEYIWHFIRGVFDGDGCVYHSTTYDKKHNRSYTYTHVAFTSASKDFSCSLVDEIKRFGIGAKMKFEKRGKNNKIYTVYIQKKYDVELFRKTMYENSGKWKMVRKFEKF